jgi:uncharacterized protein (TIGR02452 family)
MNSRQEYLVNVYCDTKEKCIEHASLLKVPKPKLYRSVMYDFKITSKFRLNCENSINVYDKDTIDIALMMKYRGLNPLVLNLASYQLPGGGVEHGASAQEECIFRRTDYHRHLHINKYPLSVMDAIYSPGVTVIKHQDYKIMHPSAFTTLDFLAISAIKHPELINGKLNQNDTNIMKNKIDQIFQIAITQGYTSLVLGALGCGAYGNPPNQIADLFASACEKYKVCFQEINFAVLSGNNNNNYAIFSSILTGIDPYATRA